MQTSILEQDGNMVAILEGRLDAVAAQETEKAMQPLCECEGKDIIIDCTHLEYISSAGLRIFLRILQNARAGSLCHDGIHQHFQAHIKT